MILPRQGIRQVTPCQLASKGQPGDSCILNLSISGNALPAGGIQGGPGLCQANPDGTPNKTQCYQPSQEHSLNITVAPAVALIDVNPIALNFVEGNTGVITVTNSVSSLLPAENVGAIIPNGSAITVQSSTCPVSLAIGASCTITFTSNAAEGPTAVLIKGTNTTTVTTTITVTPAPIANLSVTPTILLFAENSTGDITVTNTNGSPTVANNVTAVIPGGSNITVQNSTCPPSLAIGVSCTITFTANATEGPTIISIAGDNTNTVPIQVTVTNQPTISITAPVQSNRFIEVSGASLLLTITNNPASLVNANNITVTDQTNCPNVAVNDIDCVSVAPNSSCTLELSSLTPYVPCTITINGSNTANSPTTPIAFQFLNGLVFEEIGGSGKVVSLLATEFNNVEWTSTDVNIPGTSDPNDGETNTNNIVADPSCSNAPLNCAASRCRSLGAVWYLPAINELQTVASVLCPGGTCNFGGFANDAYWSSTQSGINDALGNSFPIVNTVVHPKSDNDQVRCIRTF